MKNISYPNRFVLGLMLVFGAHFMAKAQVVIDLNTYLLTNALPANTTLEWHSSAIPTTLTQLTSEQIAASPPGLYYGFYRFETNEETCYSAPSPIRFVAGGCVGSQVDLSQYVETAGLPAGNTITYHSGYPVSSANELSSIVSVTEDALKTYYVSTQAAGVDCYSSANPIVIGNVCALPITLVAFKAEKQELNTLITWETSAETNSSHFEIERSSDAKNWKQIAKQAASQQSRITTRYRQTDENPIDGINYYRLKMVDTDQSFAYSRIVNVSFENTESRVVVYPNPVSKILYFKNIAPDKATSIKFTDQSGKTLLQNLDTYSGGVITKNIPNGSYIVSWVGKDGTNYKSKVVVNK